ncbi:period circadian protein isoform X3 [Aedes aegypti]|uniref:Period circadian protein n=1 Tax=Aedes aegypti TaxID=7159 RepID=A0A6I8TFV6_AEDAE|nr:period circadian protein isoform X3 [Aedes aegypti]
MKRTRREKDEDCRTAAGLERSSIGYRVKKKATNSEEHLPGRSGCSSAIKRIIIQRLNNIVTMSATGTENLEGAESTHNTKISDSGYSNSCSNSQSQRSGSSKSRHSGSNSSGSSGYGGKGNIQAGTDVPLQHPPAKRTKDKDRKKKKLKTSVEPTPGGTGVAGEEPFSTGATAGGNFTTGSGEQVQSSVHASTVGQGEAQQNQSHVDDTDVPGGDEPTAKEDVSAVQDSAVGGETTKLHCALPGPSPVACGVTAPEENQEAVCEEVQGIQESVQGGGATPANAKTETENGFCCVISMHDGVVLFTTPSITSSLGFPNDMWLGRSFIDFVHPKDRSTFASQITSKVVVPLGESKNGVGHKDQKNSLYVMLRKYRGLKSAGFGVTGTNVNYEPYRLVLTFREAPNDTSEDIKNTGRNILLIISATPVKSVYTVSNEQLHDKELKFSTRHSTNGVLNYVDGNSVESIGYLPQDILGRSIMELYHPEDLPSLKNIYETVMIKGQTAGASFVSQPYRFLVNNGCYIVLKTEWASFVNPWSRELEFVIGNHYIQQGPSNPNVFASKFYCKDPLLFPDDLLKEAKMIEEQILRLLKEPVAKPSDMVKQEVTKRCKALASFMEELMDEVAQPELKLNLLNESDFTFSERDSVMLGEISPHHEYFDSKSSSETPPSYNQLNYNDNLQRFFESRPVMNVKESSKIHSSGGTNTETIDDQRFSGDGGESGGSAGNFSSESNVQMDSVTNTTSNTGTSSGSYQPPTLTEELLCKHNDDMQKVMLKKHREARSLARVTDKNRKGPPDKTYANIIAHGVKRGSSHSWEGDIHKTFKHQHNPDNTCDYQPQSSQALATPKPPQTSSAILDACTSIVATTAVTATPLLSSVSNAFPMSRAVELCPPFSVSVTTIQATQSNATTNIMPTSNIFPTLYYIPAPPQPTPASSALQIPRLNPITLPYMAGVMYPHPQLYQQSVLYPPMMYHAMPYQPIPPPCGLASGNRSQQQQSQQQQQSAQLPSNQSGPARIYAQPGFLDGSGLYDTSNSGGNKQQLQSIPSSIGGGGGRGSQSQHLFQRPPSQATSVKTEPGSNMAFSESSKKGLADSPRNSHVEADFPQEDMEKIRSRGSKTPGPLWEISDDMDESSFSSFYSSFLKTDNSSESNCAEKKESTEMVWDTSSNKTSRAKRRPNPPWLDNVCQTKELFYQYQITEKSVQDLLDADMLALKSLNQPILVNEQLGQLYLDLELEGLSAKLSLSDTTSGSSSDDCETQSKVKKAKRNMKYSKLVMIYEENAPFPPPAAVGRHGK